MEIQLWRLVKSGRVASSWDGEGAFRFGGRWNSRGVRAVYASSSLALALLEVLVHLDSAAPLPGLCAISARVPAKSVREISMPVGKEGVIRFPFSLQTTRCLGDDWIRSNAGVALVVPSAIVPTESNYLINPGHPGFQGVKIERAREFLFDDRLRPEGV